MKRLICGLLALALVLAFAAAGAEPLDKAEMKSRYTLVHTSVGEGGRFIIYADNRYGFADLEGNVLAEPQWRQADNFRYGRTVVQPEGSDECVVLDMKLREIFRLKCASLDPMDENTYKIMARGKDGYIYGLADAKGKILIEPQYQSLFRVSETLYEAEDADESCWLVNRKGKKVSKTAYQMIGSEEDGLIRVQTKEGKYGFLDEKGKTVIKPQFDSAGDFRDGMARVTVREKMGIINTKGKYVIQAKYEDLSTFSEGLIAAKKDGKYGYLDEKGKTAVKFKYEKASDFSEKLAFVVDGEGKGFFINPKGKAAVEIPYKAVSARAFRSGLAVVKVELEPEKPARDEDDADRGSSPGPVDGGFGANAGGFGAPPEAPDDGDGGPKTAYCVISKKGKVVIEPVYDDITRIGSSVFAAGNIEEGHYVPGEYVILNAKGKKIFKEKVKSIPYSFGSDGLAAFTGGNGWYILNEKGEIVY